MDTEDPVLLSPEQKLREQEVITRCFNLMRDERSRYEQQAQILLTRRFVASESEFYELAYSIQGDRYICNANSLSPLRNSFSIELPIPNTREGKIESLIELFAQSEAGLIT